MRQEHAMFSMRFLGQSMHLPTSWEAREANEENNPG
jgi:hypothetical protein